MEHINTITNTPALTNDGQQSITRPLAIVAICLAGISVIIPIIGIFGAIFSCWIAAFCFKHEQTRALITAGISIINIFLLSPFLWGVALESAENDLSTAFAGIWVFSLIFQVLPLAVGYSVTRKK